MREQKPQRWMRGLAGVLIACTGLASPMACGPEKQSAGGSGHFDAALGAARWLQHVAVDTPHGRIWPDEADSTQKISTGIGTGVAGTTLFFLALHRATQNAQHLDDARRGADYLLRSFSNAHDSTVAAAPMGLYNGLAGEAYVLNEAFRATQLERYRLGALRRIEALHQHVERNADGIAWNAYDDVLNGTAGIGLLLLYAAQEMDHATSLPLAVEAGHALLRRGIRDAGGEYWKIGPATDYNIPNFSHGTAGVGYFLATLYAATERDEFLVGALAAAHYLQAIAKTEDGVFLVPYGIPNEGFDVPYDIGWAHGPAGTARLFYRLWQITGDRAWLDVVYACARGLMESGVPDAPVSADFGQEPFRLDMRFGMGGAAVFLLDLYEATGQTAFLDSAEHIIDTIVAASVQEDGRTWWTLPRYGFQGKEGTPTAFTGYFYGAAGFGWLLLRSHAARHGHAPSLILPDNPFPAPYLAPERTD